MFVLYISPIIYVGVADRAGLKVSTYKYYDKTKDCLDILGLLTDLKSIPDNSNVLLHVCAHNPTGLDPTPEQWGDIMRVVKSKNHVPVFDCAYQVRSLLTCLLVCVM